MWLRREAIFFDAFPFIRHHQVNDSLMKGALFPEDNGKVSSLFLGQVRFYMLNYRLTLLAFAPALQ